MAYTYSPIVSIITVSLNSESTIGETIESVINQDYKNIEYIIIDGGSTDGTMDIISKYNGYIDVVVSEPDSGIYSAMNKGILKANGEIIGIINSDDYYCPNAISLVVDKWSRHERPDAIIGWVDILNHEHQSQGMLGKPIIGVNKEVRIPHPSAFISANAYRRLGMFDTSFKYSADSELFYRFFFAGATFVVLNGVVAAFRQGGFGSRVGFLAQKENFFIERKFLGLSFSMKNFVKNACLSFALRCIYTLKNRR